MKQGFTNAGEMSNGTLVRRVQLPQSYFNNANTIFSEIKKEANIALEAQKKALIIKEKYKNKICKDSVKVDFMDNKEYKAICKEDEKIAQLKTKIDAKLAQIEQQKQAKRQQQNEQRLIQEILGRGKKKDFWDIAELFSHYTMDQMISYHKKKYPSQMLGISIPYALTYFNDADESEDPETLKIKNWDEVKKIISQKVREFLI